MALDIGHHAKSPIQGVIDSHCHIEESRDPIKLINACKRYGMSCLITCSAKIEDMEKTISLASENRGFLYYTLGLHPTFAINSKEQETWEYIAKIKELKDTSFVGVGEVGLDYFLVKEKEQRETSREIFIQFIELANKIEKPLIIHCRDAYPELLDILSTEFNGTAVFHYFNQPEYANEITNKGWYLSIPFTISKSKIVKIFEESSLDNIIIETDSPIVLNDREITPLNILDLVEKISIATKIEKEKIIEKTTKNVKKVFRI